MTDPRIKEALDFADHAPDSHAETLAAAYRAALARCDEQPTVPMAMLEATYDLALDYGRGLSGRDKNAIRDIAARYGYKVTEA